jgi:hypothetical protein
MRQHLLCFRFCSASWLGDEHRKAAWCCWWTFFSSDLSCLEESLSYFTSCGAERRGFSPEAPMSLLGSVAAAGWRFDAKGLRISCCCLCQNLRKHSSSERLALEWSSSGRILSVLSLCETLKTHWSATSETSLTTSTIRQVGRTGVKPLPIY